jgi:hypothetical protein
LQHQEDTSKVFFPEEGNTKNFEAVCTIRILNKETLSRRQTKHGLRMEARYMNFEISISRKQES